MLLALDKVPFLHNTAASAACWLLLAGFVVLPGTFSTLSTLDTSSGTLTATVIHEVQNIPLFVIAYLLSSIGASGMIWLWWRWRKNYIWLLNRIFTPGALNGLAGVISTVASVFGSQNSVFNASSITTLAVTGAVTVICASSFFDLVKHDVLTFPMGSGGGLTLFYTFVLLQGVKRRHEKAVGKESTGKHGEGMLKAAKEVMRS